MSNAASTVPGRPARVLDFSSHGEIRHGHMAFNLRPWVEPLAALPRTLERARACTRFLCHLGDTDDQMHCAADEILPMREAYLRAALAEFVSIEDILPRDLATTGAPDNPFKFWELTDPLVHIVRELRNFEIHLQAKGLISDTRTCWWGNTQRPEEMRPFENTLWTLTPLTIEEFLELRNARQYDPRDLSRLLDWFNESQAVWGIEELVYQALLRVCAEIVRRFEL